MSQAYDAFVISTSSKPIILSSLKKILRFIATDDVTMTFSDGSKLIYKRTASYRTDKLEIIQDDV